MVRSTTGTWGKRHCAMTTKASGKLRQADRVNVGRKGGGGDNSKASGGNGVVKCGKDVIGGAWRKCAEEVTEARPDAEAQEGVTLIRSHTPCAVREKEAVQDGNEARGTGGSGGNGGANVGQGADRSAKHRVARSNQGAITTEHSISTVVRRET